MRTGLCNAPTGHYFHPSVARSLSFARSQKPRRPRFLRFHTNSLHASSHATTSGSAALHPLASRHFSDPPPCFASCLGRKFAAVSQWGSLASWICAWLEAIGLIAGTGMQELKPCRALFCSQRGLIRMEDTSHLEVVGGTLVVIMLPLVAPTTQSASYAFTKVDIASVSTGITSPLYSVLMAWLVSQYSLYGYDAAAHLTEETRNADKNGPLAILSSIGMISIFVWAFILALTFSIQCYLPGSEIFVRPFK